MKVEHYRYATLPYGNILSSQVPWDGLFTVRSMFSYGRGVRERSEFYRLKAGYFTLKFDPHMVHDLRIELS